MTRSRIKSAPRKKVRKEIQTSGLIDWRTSFDIPDDKISASVEIVSDPLHRANSTERDYYLAHIEPLITTGECIEWGYELLVFQLGYKQSFRPDFYTLDRNGALTLHEVKGGYIFPDAYEKLKAFVTIYPRFPLILAQWKDKQWKIERVPRR